jgi:uncharacterized protein YgfB (UPF0149 family)
MTNETEDKAAKAKDKEVATDQNRAAASESSEVGKHHQDFEAGVGASDEPAKISKEGVKVIEDLNKLYKQLDEDLEDDHNKHAVLASLTNFQLTVKRAYTE